jgi:phage-related protein
MHRVLFYKTNAGNEVVLDWLRSLDADDRKRIGEDLRVVQLGFPMGKPLCDSLGGGLWEVRSSLPSRREARLLFFHSRAKRALVVVHGFIKKTRTAPAGDIELARRRRREFQD